MEIRNRNIIVLTSMRTGSTWLCNLLSGLLQTKFGFAKTLEQVAEIWEEGKFVKAHNFTVETVFKLYPDAIILSTSRNPKDRTSSQVFFKKYSVERTDEIIKKNATIQEERHLDRMWKGYSSKAKGEREFNYWWTTYEWLKEDTERELRNLADFLEVKYTDMIIRFIVISVQDFCMQKGRIRKGRVDSWKEEIFAEKLLVLDKHQEMYYNVVNGELTKEE